MLQGYKGHHAHLWIRLSGAALSFFASAAVILILIAFGLKERWPLVFNLTLVGLGLSVLLLIATLAAQIQALRSELHSTRRKFVNLMRALPDGLASFDADGRLIFVNKKLKLLLKEAGFDISRQVQRTQLLNFLFHHVDAKGPINLIETAAETSFDIEYSPNRWVQVMEKRGADLKSVILVSDSTNCIVGKAALEQSLDRERDTTAIYRNFVSVVSHQFRTPLAIIDSSAQRILRYGGTHSPEVVSRIERIRNAAMRLTQLVDSTLLASRLDEGQLDMKLQFCDFAELVRSLCVRHQEIAAHRTIEVSSCSEKLVIECDPLLMEQVLSNLLSNAVKYSPDGSPILVRCWSDETSIHCSISDKGIGIPQDELPRLFERFFRARTAVGFTGTGLGLNFAHYVTSLHGGTITVRSEENVGSTFIVTLPLPKAEQGQAAA